MKKLRFVISLVTQESDYQRELADAAQRAAARLGVDLQILFAENDSITQSQQLIRAIQDSSAGINALIAEPAGGTAFPQAARAAAAAGLGWVVLNRHDSYIEELRGKYSVPMYSVSVDHEEVGKIHGRQIAALLPGGGTVLYLQGPSSSSVSQLRVTGINESKPKNIQLKSLKSADWTEKGGQRAVTSWLQLSTSRDCDIQGVIAQNDFIALGAQKAFQEIAATAERDKWFRLPFIGADGLKIGQAAVHRGLFAATVVLPPTTGLAIEMMVRALREGFHPPARTLIDPTSLPEVRNLTPRSSKAQV